MAPFCTALIRAMQSTSTAVEKTVTDFIAHFSNSSRTVNTDYINCMLICVYCRNATILCCDHELLYQKLIIS